MSADKNSINNNDHSGESKTRVIVKSKKVGYFNKLFGKATPTTNESVIIEENGNIIDVRFPTDSQNSRCVALEKFKEKTAIDLSLVSQKQICIEM